MTDFVLGYAEKLWDRTTPEYRALVVAFILAPTMGALLIWLAGPAPSTHATISPPLNVMPLRAHAAGPRDPATTVVIVQPTEATFTMPWTRPLSALPTSLSEEQWRGNTAKISQSNRTISIVVPLAGVQEPFVFLTQDAPPDAVEISGRKYAMADLRLRSQQATDILLGVLISAAFALGVGVSTASIPIQAQEHGSG
ncbi:MAG: hypothetical protein JO197_09690 [Acidobacteria bacterium]|nr:hypothetical protein [Acidobacteriota bacterium]MBV9477368.1 hypothetical protein [Acidobacteriota bacterium]